MSPSTLPHAHARSSPPQVAVKWLDEAPAPSRSPLLRFRSASLGSLGGGSSSNCTLPSPAAAELEPAPERSPFIGVGGGGGCGGGRDECGGGNISVKGSGGGGEGVGSSGEGGGGDRPAKGQVAGEGGGSGLWRLSEGLKNIAAGAMGDVGSPSHRRSRAQRAQELTISLAAVAAADERRGRSGLFGWGRRRGGAAAQSPGAEAAKRRQRNLRRDVRVMAQLRHPNVATVMGWPPALHHARWL